MSVFLATWSRLTLAPPERDVQRARPLEVPNGVRQPAQEVGDEDELKRSELERGSYAEHDVEGNENGECDDGDGGEQTDRQEENA